MKTIMKNLLPLSVLSAVVLATVGSAVAAEVDEVSALSKPESTGRVGLGYVPMTTSALASTPG